MFYIVVGAYSYEGENMSHASPIYTSLQSAMAKAEQMAPEWDYVTVYALTESDAPKVIHVIE